MAAIQQQGQPHWRDTLIQKSEAISDAWEVAKAYAGRVAEWVLFGCMIFNIIEMLPGISMPQVISNVVLGIQVVMLDVGGFALASMADHARRMGDEEAAKKAESTGKFLIGLMIVTLLVVAIGVLFPDTLVYVVWFEKALILLRVVMTVIYGHVIHSLRSSGENIVAQHQEQTGALQSEITRLQQLLATSKREANETQSRLQNDLTVARTGLEHLQKEVVRLQNDATDRANVLENAQLDAQAWRAKVAHLETQLAQSYAQTRVLESALAARKKEGENAQENETPDAPNVTMLRATRTAKMQAVGSLTGAERAEKVLKRKPDITPAELAQKADIDVTYARKILAKIREQQAVNE